MSELYNHQEVEQKWQKVWDDENAFAASNDYSKPKYYALVEFPYPSGQGLHVGHPRPYTALDIVEPINATHHGYYYGAYCTNCAYDYIGPKILHLTERHVWSGDRCTICGYTR